MGISPESAGADSIITEGDGFFVPQARGIYQAIAICWSSNVYIPELGHRFWKLTLQVSSLCTMRIDLKDVKLSPTRFWGGIKPGWSRHYQFGEFPRQAPRLKSVDCQQP